MTIKEELRHGIAVALGAGGWLGAMGILIWATVNYDPSDGRFAPQWVGLSIIILVGIAIAAGTALARMKNSRTMSEVLRAGLVTRDKANDKGEE